jgi:hypothetical protein
MSASAVAGSEHFAGYLDRLTNHAITIQQADGVAISALLPRKASGAVQAIARQCAFGDQIVISCRHIRPVYDRDAGRYQTLEMLGLQRVRPASIQEMSRIALSHGWASGGNLLKTPDRPFATTPVTASLENNGENPAQSEIALARKVNLEVGSRLPNFIADEIAQVYVRSSEQKDAWRLEYEVEAEVTFDRGQTRRRNIRKNGQPWTEPVLPGHTGYGGFGNLLVNLFGSQCPNTFKPVGPSEINGKQTLQFRVDAEPDTCFALESDYQAYRPRIEGAISLENPGARLVQFEYTALNLPQSFFLSSWVRKVSWGDVRIGDEVFLLPVRADLVVANSLTHGSRQGETEHIVWEYRNYRHFESESTVTFH